MAGTILLGVDVESASPAAEGYALFGGEMFRELAIPVTWYLTGKTLETYPDAFRELENDPLIELQAHTYNHVLLKTVFMRVPEGKRIHGSTDWYLECGGSNDEIDADLAKCQQVFEDVLGRRAVALTGPWGYFRGLGDRPDLLEIVDRHGLKVLRTFARNEWDAQPVPLEWQPFFYRAQGFPDTLEILVHGYQDDFYWEAFDGEGRYTEYLKSVADRVAAEGLTWSLCSHDHGCETKEGFEKKGAWLRETVKHAQGLGIRFLTASQFRDEMLTNRDEGDA